MATPDKETQTVYEQMVSDYVKLTKCEGPSRDLLSFIEELPESGKVLDMGCGPGHAARNLIDAGFDVDAVDASAEMVKAAQERFGVKARIATFSDLDAHNQYDGVYANFSLLHARKTDFPDHIAQIFRALKAGGVLHLGMKTGSGEHRDALGRLYAYYSKEELEERLSEAGFKGIRISREGKAPGLAGNVEPFVIMRAHA